jgi:DNA replication protein DnaC
MLRYYYLNRSQKQRYKNTEKAFASPFYMKKIDLFDIEDQKKIIINEAFNSKTRYYLIVGENGVGKTTLIQSIVEDLKN